MFKVGNHVIFFSPKMGHISVGTTIREKKSMFCIICCFGTCCGKKITVTLGNNEKHFHMAQWAKLKPRLKRTFVFFYYCFVKCWILHSLQMFWEKKNSTELSPRVPQVYTFPKQVSVVCASLCKVVSGKNERTSPVLYSVPFPQFSPSPSHPTTMLERVTEMKADS